MCKDAIAYAARSGTLGRWPYLGMWRNIETSVRWTARWEKWFAENAVAWIKKMR